MDQILNGFDAFPTVHMPFLSNEIHVLVPSPSISMFQDTSMFCCIGLLSFHAVWHMIIFEQKMALIEGPWKLMCGSLFFGSVRFSECLDFAMLCVRNSLQETLGLCLSQKMPLSTAHWCSWSCLYIFVHNFSHQLIKPLTFVRHVPYVFFNVFLHSSIL